MSKACSENIIIFAEAIYGSEYRQLVIDGQHGMSPRHGLFALRAHSIGVALRAIAAAARRRTVFLSVDPSN